MVRTLEDLKPHRSKPLGQFFQVGSVHVSNKLPTVDIVNGKYVIFVKDDLITLLQAVQSSLDERIVNEASEETA